MLKASAGVLVEGAAMQVAVDPSGGGGNAFADSEAASSGDAAAGAGGIGSAGGGGGNSMNGVGGAGVVDAEAEGITATSGGGEADASGSGYSLSFGSGLSDGTIGGRIYPSRGRRNSRFFRWHDRPTLALPLLLAMAHVLVLALVVETVEGVLVEASGSRSLQNMACKSHFYIFLHRASTKNDV